MSSNALSSPIIAYEQNFLSSHAVALLLNPLMDPASTIWQSETFQLFGKRTPVPRRLAWFGDEGVNYRYTRLNHLASGWPEYLLALKVQICERFDLEFNFVLLNRYDHGGQYMGWHRDDEKAAAPVIASLSIGDTRRFCYRQDPDVKAEEINLTSGSLLVFDGRCQHKLAKTAKLVGPRINLTFRYIAQASR